MGAPGKRTNLHRASRYWPASAVDPRSLVARPCRFNPDLFTSTHWADKRVALMSCNGCPQVLTCLRHGIELDEAIDVVGGRGDIHGTEGIYGGMTRTQRAKLRRDRERKP